MTELKSVITQMFVYLVLPVPTVNHVAVCARHLGNLWLPGEPTWTGAERGRHVSDIVGDTVFVFSSHSIYNYKFVFLGLLEDLFCNLKFVIFSTFCMIRSYCQCTWVLSYIQDSRALLFIYSKRVHRCW